MSDIGKHAGDGHRLWLSRVTNLVGPLLPDPLRWRLRQALFDLKSFQKRLPGGLLARIEGFADWEVYCEIFVEGVYDLAIDNVLAGWDRQRPFRFVDLGANVGYFTLRLADELRHRFGADIELSGTLIDGNPAMIEQQRRRLVDDNRLRGVDIVHGLAGRRDGTGIFRTAPRHGHSSLASDGVGIATSFVDLAAMCAADEMIDLLKMDVEGAEELILETYPELFRKVRVATLELHHDKCDTERCKVLLREAGLRHAHALCLYETTSMYTAWK